MIVAMNLASVDLNLLVAFEALMQEQHVTRAGQRIGLAQPSMSSALARLRSLFGDQLFTRTGQTMRPTSRAMDLALPISAALEQLRRALDPNPKFEPRTGEARFTVAATDYDSLIVLPKVVSALRHEAPGVDLRVHPMTDRALFVKQLERGEIDVMICSAMPTSSLIIRHSLFLERLVCIRDSSRVSAGTTFGKREYGQLPHAWFKSEGGEAPTATTNAVLAASAEGDEAHRVALMLPHIVAVPFAVADTDLIATISERVARRFATAAGVCVVELPFEVPPYNIYLGIARHRSDEAPLRWFVDLIRRESRDL